MGYQRSRSDLHLTLARLGDALQALELTLGDHPTGQTDALVERCRDAATAVVGEVEEIAANAADRSGDDAATISRHVRIERLLLATMRRFHRELADPANLRQVQAMAARRSQPGASAAAIIIISSSSSSTSSEWLAWARAYDAAIAAVLEQCFAALAAAQECLAELGERLEPASAT